MCVCVCGVGEVRGKEKEEEGADCTEGKLGLLLPGA